MILVTTSLCHVTVVLLSSTLMKFLNMPCWQYFPDTHFGLKTQWVWFTPGHRNWHKLCFWLNLFPVHTLTKSHPLLSDYIVTVTLCGFVSHMLLFIFGRFCVSFYNSIQFECVKLALGTSRYFTDGCPYSWDCGSLLLNYSHLYLSGAVLICWMLVSRLLEILLCITRLSLRTTLKKLV